jgi:uncharacterized protein
MRSFSLSSLIISLSITILSISMVLPDKRVWALLPVALLLLIAILIRSRPATHISIFCFLFLGFPLVLPAFCFWPWKLLVPLVIYNSIVLLIPELRESYQWMKLGRISKHVLILMLIIVFGSALALFGWYFFMKPDLSHHLSHFPNISFALIPIAGIGFAFLNAVMEEFAFRGIIMHGFDCTFNNDTLSILLQALSFGLFHYVAGFPNGIAGIFMTLIYGFLLGYIRNMSQGLLAPIVTHFFADLTIFSILAICLLKSGAGG